MNTAAIFLGLAALGGLAMLVVRLGGTPRPPTWMALGHGLIAAIGVVLLAYAAYDPGIPQRAQIALGIFVAAALGGAVLFLGFHLKEKALPVPFILVHGLIALSGLGLLLDPLYGGA